MKTPTKRNLPWERCEINHPWNPGITPYRVSWCVTDSGHNMNGWDSIVRTFATFDEALAIASEKVSGRGPFHVSIDRNEVVNGCRRWVKLAKRNRGETFKEVAR